MKSLAERLEYLRKWWERHGSGVHESADTWINSLDNVELIEALSWADEE